jgi:hypothetical protein
MALHTGEHGHSGQADSRIGNGAQGQFDAQLPGRAAAAAATSSSTLAQNGQPLRVKRSCLPSGMSAVAAIRRRRCSLFRHEAGVDREQAREPGSARQTPTRSATAAARRIKQKPVLGKPVMERVACRVTARQARHQPRRERHEVVELLAGVRSMQRSWPEHLRTPDLPQIRVAHP